MIGCKLKVIVHGTVHGYDKRTHIMFSEFKFALTTFSNSRNNGFFLFNAS